MAPVKTHKACTVSKWYKPDDQKVHFKRKRAQPKKMALRKNITPGTVLILLAGKYRGKRVVFLKQLESGLLLVSGPYKVNGVPLKRVNQAYVIPTKTSVSLQGVVFDKVNDKSFEKVKAKAAKKSQENFFQSNKTELSADEKKKLEERNKLKYAEQVSVDKSLIANIKKTELLKKYLSSRFSLTKNQRPHEMIF